MDEENTREYAARGNPDRKVLGLSKNCGNHDDTAHRIEDWKFGIQKLKT